MKSAAAPVHQTLIDQLLAEQHRLTAVEKFAGKHERHELPAQQQYYRDLIPLTQPRPGEQFAFEVDLDACSGCKACVTACHSLNGLDETETWRKVGTLIGGTRARPFQQTVTTACHHCVEPGCLNGCPVEAYEKDKVTGIVRHLDDQCIGCQYCSWTCPYDVPQFSKKRGIVRKCDMCHGRLADGEAPACVQACPNGAIAIRVVSVADARERARQGVFLPASPEPALTIPTTRFVTGKSLPAELRSAAGDDLKPEPAHLPLILMLVFTQMAAGLFALNLLLDGAASRFTARVGTMALFIGLATSVAHLGRPLHAWRSFLGWKHSWLSREVIGFGVFAVLAVFNLVLLHGKTGLQELQNFSSATVCAAGVAAVFCSAMLYHATKREFWHLRYAAGRFFGTSIVLGCSAALAISSALPQGWFPLLAPALMLVTLAKIGFELSFLRVLDIDEPSPLQRSGQLLATRLRWVNGIRIAVGLTGGVLLPFFHLLAPNPVAVCIGFALCLCGELLERYLFFTAVAPSKMPGDY